jgi:hypothetical protein
LARAYTNQEIGEKLDIATTTVKLHVKAILKALKAANRTEAALMFTVAVPTEPAQHAPSTTGRRIINGIGSNIDTCQRPSWPATGASARRWRG